jgi:hypothetical protein
MSGFNSEFLTSPVTYEEKHSDVKYDMVKFEVRTDDGRFHKLSFPQYEGKRGVEGLFYCKDKFDELANDYQFDAQDYFRYFPRILDQTTLRWWTNRIARLDIPEQDRNMATFNVVFQDFLTSESGSLNPRDDLIAYLSTDECKKPRKVDVRSHANRIETLCLYANRLEGVKAILTDDAITMIIFHSFPNAWLNEFRLARGNPVNSGRAAILEFFTTKKAVQDSSEEQNKKRKKEDKDKEGNGKHKSGKKQRTGEGNMCRKHKTHPWSECSENPKSKNYYLKPGSPFFRGGRGGSRGGGRGYGAGRGGRGDYQGGRGGGRGPHSRDGGDHYHNDDRGRDYNDDRAGRRDNGSNDRRGSGERGSNDHTPNRDNYYNNNRPGGWY